MKTLRYFTVLALIACLFSCKDKDVNKAPLKDLTPFIIKGRIDLGTGRDNPFLLHPVDNSVAKLFYYGYEYTFNYTLDKGRFNSEVDFPLIGKVNLTAEFRDSTVINPRFVTQSDNTSYPITEALLLKKPSQNEFAGKTFRSGIAFGYKFIRLQFASGGSPSYSTAFEGNGLWGVSTNYTLFYNMACVSNPSGVLQHGILVNGELEALLTVGGQSAWVKLKEE